MAGVGPGVELCYPKAAVSLWVLLQPRGSAGFPVQSLIPCPAVSHLGFLSLVGNLVQRAILMNHVFFAILHSSSTIHSSFFLMARTLLEFTNFGKIVSSGSSGGLECSSSNPLGVV